MTEVFAKGAGAAARREIEEGGASARERLLAAALEVLFDQGYKGATSRRIARAAGVNEVTIFRLFGTKDDLLAAALIVRAEQDLTLQPVPTGDLVSDLTSLAELVMHTHTAGGHLLVRLFSQIVHLPAEQAARVRGALHRTLQASRALFQHYQASGELKVEPGDQVWLTFMGPILMGLRGAEIDAGLPRFDVHEHVRLFLQGCRPAGTCRHQAPS